MRADWTRMALALWLGGMAGQARAQTPSQAPKPAPAPTVPVAPGNPPGSVGQATTPPYAGPNPIPKETKEKPGTKGSDANGLAPIREVPPPVTPSTEASNLQPGTGTISSNPAGLPITPNPALSSITPYLFHGYGYPSVGYMMPYGYRRSPYEGLGPPSDFGRMRRMARLMNDLDQLIPGRAVADGRVEQLRQDIEAVVYAKDRPPAAVIQQLATDLARVVPARNVPMLDTGQIAHDIEIVVNAGRSSPAQLQDAIESVRRKLWHSGVGDRGILTIVADLRTITSGDVASATADGKPITYIP